MPYRHVGGAFFVLMGGGAFLGLPPSPSPYEIVWGRPCAALLQYDFLTFNIIKHPPTKKKNQSTILGLGDIEHIPQVKGHQNKK